MKSPFLLMTGNKLFGIDKECSETENTFLSRTKNIMSEQMDRAYVVEKMFKTL